MNKSSMHQCFLKHTHRPTCTRVCTHTHTPLQRPVAKVQLQNSAAVTVLLSLSPSLFPYNLLITWKLPSECLGQMRRAESAGFKTFEDMLMGFRHAHSGGPGLMQVFAWETDSPSQRHVDCTCFFPESVSSEYLFPLQIP